MIEISSNLLVKKNTPPVEGNTLVTKPYSKHNPALQKAPAPQKYSGSQTRPGPQKPEGPRKHHGTQKSSGPKKASKNTAKHQPASKATKCPDFISRINSKVRQVAYSYHEIALAIHERAIFFQKKTFI